MILHRVTHHTSATYSLICCLQWACNRIPLSALAPDDSLLKVKTTSGQIHGATRSRGGAEFLGIPYAEPPIGDLRWRPPVPIATPRAGVRDAYILRLTLFATRIRRLEPARRPIRQGRLPLPQRDRAGWPVKNPLPVMFWIHGGANEGGTASSALYKDGTLVNHGVILVTINYRLGIFGFLAHPELTRESSSHSSGNYGLMDQILALFWVRDNIAKFGGDPITSRFSVSPRRD